MRPALRRPRSARGVGTNGAPPQPTRDARSTRDPLAATFDSAQGQADGHPCAFRAPVSKPRTAGQCMPKAAMNLIRRTTCSPRAKSRRVTDRLIGDAAKLPSSPESAGKRETPTRETGSRLANSRRSAQPPLRLTTLRRCVTGNWRTCGAVVWFPGRYWERERESSPTRTPGPQAKCLSCAPEDAAGAVIFADSLFGLGILALPEPSVGYTASLTLAKAIRDAALRAGANFSMSGLSGALRGTMWRILK